ncbi:ABC transporter permease [Cupriavidus sp. TMH.W2]|uniref:ABC transporter permease n=1 Tax=Cupriavidus sp. TMH.W2 TaxID=3434465 RepID=UPI003D77AD46
MNINTRKDMTISPTSEPLGQRVLDFLGGPDIAYRLVAVALLCAALAMASGNFLTEGNLLNVLRQASLLFLIASGLTVVLIAGGIDLSVGANLGLSACLAGLTLKATGSIPLAFVVGIGTGTCAGLLNGVLVSFMRVPPFIATYGMLWVLTGLTYLVMHGDAIAGFPGAFRFIGSGYLAGIPVPVYLMVAFLITGGLFARMTTYGQQTYAIGANPEAALLSGVPVRSRQILVYTMSGAMAGLAALVFLARVNSAEGDIGETLTLPAITAALIGGTSLFGGVGTLTGTLIGALMMTLVINGMNLLSVDTNWQPFVMGVMVVLAVLVDRLSHRR